MASRPMPGPAKSEIEKQSHFQIGYTGRDYRQVNDQNRRDSEGMTKIGPSDKSYGDERTPTTKIERE